MLVGEWLVVAFILAQNARFPFVSIAIANFQILKIQ
jgi:hypothetical protein